MDGSIPMLQIPTHMHSDRKVPCLLEWLGHEREEHPMDFLLSEQTDGTGLMGDVRKVFVVCVCV